MAITLDAITLPEDLIWVDEFDWSPIAQGSKRSITGALILNSGVKLKGRKITLVGEENWVDCLRSLVKTLHTKLGDDAQMILTLHDARSFNVRFDHQSKPINAQPVIDYNNPDDSDNYSLTLRFFTV